LGRIIFYRIGIKERNSLQHYTRAVLHEIRFSIALYQYLLVELELECYGYSSEEFTMGYIIAPSSDEFLRYERRDQGFTAKKDGTKLVVGRTVTLINRSEFLAFFGPQIPQELGFSLSRRKATQTRNSQLLRDLKNNTGYATSGNFHNNANTT
jgi:hypothetical protein